MISLAIVEVTAADWEKEVLKSSLSVLVDFHSPYCPPCFIMEKILVNIAENYSERVKFVRVDINKEEEIAERYDILSVPTIAFFISGELIQGFTGVIHEKSLVKNIDAILERV